MRGACLEAAAVEVARVVGGPVEAAVSKRERVLGVRPGQRLKHARHVLHAPRQRAADVTRVVQWHYSSPAATPDVIFSVV